MSGNILPNHFTRHEQMAALSLIDHGRSWVNPYAGNWKASWLLNNIHDPIWLLRTNKSRLIKGNWEGACKIYWNILLPDGTRLTDKTNHRMLITVQKMAFLIRHLPSFRITKTLTHVNWIENAICITQWLYLHTDIYNPRIFLFNKVNSDAITDFLSDFVKGGKAWALQVPHRILRFMYRKALGHDPSRHIIDNLFDVPDIDRIKIIKWLQDSNLYEYKYDSHGKRLNRISRIRLGSHIELGIDNIRSRKISAFLRQFEPDLLHTNNQLLIESKGISTEYPAHVTLTISEVVQRNISDLNATSYINNIKQIFRLHKHLPDAIPSTDRIDFTRAKHIALTETEPTGTTPWVPLKTSLAYTTESLRWIALYGEAIVDIYIQTIITFSRRKWFNIPGEPTVQQYHKAKKRNAWLDQHLPQKLRSLGVSEWTSVFAYRHREDSFNQFRNNPGLNDVLQIFVGASILLILITKPQREEELLLLHRNCLSFKKNDGYWLTQNLEKSGTKDSLFEIARPIPTITAKAISLLARLGDGLKKAHNEQGELELNSLFYMPMFQRNGSLVPRLLDREQMKDCLERFCDYVALPPDELGRRWYIRSHECRKTFLITFFWCFRYASLDAARWMAGLSDAKDIYTYIQANFPGEELPHIEAEYAAMALWDFAQAGERGETENVEELQASVCRHFGVSQISMINKQDLDDWLETAFRKNIYAIQPYQIKSRNGEIDITIAFKIHEGKTSAKKGTNS